MRLPQQAAGQFGLGREHGLVRYPGQLAALLVGRPVRGQVQGTADQGMPGRDRVRQRDRDLAQGDAAYGAAVPAVRADRRRRTSRRRSRPASRRVSAIPRKLAQLRDEGGDEAVELAWLLRTARVRAIVMPGSAITLVAAAIQLALVYE